MANPFIKLPYPGDPDPTIKSIDDFINDDLTVKWNVIEQIPEFQELKKGGYHSIYHKEGDSFEHTKRVVEAAYILPEWNDLTVYYKCVLVLACLFHDIGKSKTNFLKDDGNWSAPYHASEGEKIARFILWDKDFFFREKICSLIYYHMKIRFLYFKKGDSFFKQYLEMDVNSDVYLLYLLAKCDILGSISDDQEESLKRMEALKKDIIDMNISTGFVNNFEKFYYFNDEDVLIKYTNRLAEFENGKDPLTDFTVYIMCGVSGGGKSTYVKEKLNGIKVISRDIVRQELGYVDSNGKFKGSKDQEDKVTQIVDKQVLDCCRNKISFVYDNLNIRKKYRDDFVKSILKYNPEIIIVYSETSKENHINRRKGQIDENKIIKMMKEMDFPRQTECFELKNNLNFKI